jgi:hypothetical protein
MNNLQLGLVLVASVWAAVNTLIAGYNAVNGTRDRIVTGFSVEGIPLSLEHRWVLYRNDWRPLKAGLALVSLAFAAFILFLPELADQATGLRMVCYTAAILPVGSFLGFAAFGLSDRRLILDSLSKAETGADPRQEDVLPEERPRPIEPAIAADG